MALEIPKIKTTNTLIEELGNSALVFTKTLFSSSSLTPPSSAEIAGASARITLSNVQTAWKDYTGKSVTIGILEGYLNANDKDLASKYDTAHDYTYNKTSNDYLAVLKSENTSSGHATQVAKVAAASADNSGTVGIAYGSTLVGLAASSGAASTGASMNAIGAALRAGAVTNGVDVINISLGVGSNTYTSSSTLVSNMKAATTYGREGLGTIIVAAAGNTGADIKWNVNASPYSITVGAIDAAGKFASYSSRGENINLVAQSDGGTSFSAPVVTGAVALLLEANPNLSYRDVQEILAYSSKLVDGVNNFGYNAAGNLNGSGLHFSKDAGFGKLDVTAAVRLAETWNTQNNIKNIHDVTVNGVKSASDKTGDTYTFTIKESIDIDRVQISFVGSKLSANDTITLISPHGTVMTVTTNILDSMMISNRFWGEDAQGTWTVKSTASAEGKITGLDLQVFGSTGSENDTYFFNNEFATLKTANTVITDKSGVDAINASMVTSDVTINLGAGTHSTIAGRDVMIDSKTVIEKVFSGDGNDTLTGNDADNVLFAGRGNDILNGGKGNDTLVGFTGDDTYILSSGLDTIIDQGGNDRIVVTNVLSMADVVFGKITSNPNDLVMRVAGQGDVIIKDAALGTVIEKIDIQFTNLSWKTLAISEINFSSTLDLSTVLKVTPLITGENTMAVSSNLLQTKEDTATAFKLTASNNSDTTSVIKISGLPAGATLTSTAGVFDPVTKTFTITLDKNQKLDQTFTVQGALNSDTDLKLNIVKVDTDSANKSTSTTKTVDIVVDAVADAPVLNVNNHIYVNPSDTVAIKLDASLTDKDGSEKLSVYLKGIPNDMLLNHGTKDSSGVWTVQQSDLADLKLVTSTTTASNFKITVVAESMELDGKHSTSVVEKTVDVEFGGKIFQGTDRADYLVGGTGHDLMIGGASNDILRGGAGNDTMYGGAGNDYLIGGKGVDKLYGGDGNDILIADDGVSWKTSLMPTQGDLLVGGKGNDFMIGSMENDIIVFDGGRDWAYGFGGADIFKFEKGGYGQIADFNLKEGDKLDLSNLLEKFDPVTDAIADFVKATNTAQGMVISVDADGKGSGAAVDVAILFNIHDMNVTTMHDKDQILA